MSDDSVNSKWDKKSLGAGGISAAVALALLQSQGINLMNKQQDANDNVIIEKTVANSQRIQRLEESMTDLQRQIRDGFDKNREEIRSEINRMGDLMRISSSDRFTKSEHAGYAEAVKTRIDRIDKDIIELRKTKMNKTKGE